MANKTKTMLQIRRILQLLEQGKTPGSIGRELCISINTVKKYRKNFLLSTLNYQQLFGLEDQSLQLIAYPQKSKSKTSNAHRFESLANLLPDYIKRLKTKHITRELLWMEYKKDYSDGYSYSQFCDYLQKDLLRSNTVMHLEHKPGDCLQIDFAGDKLSYVDKQSGEIISCPVLVCTMPFSSFTYLEALSNQSQVNLISSLNRCLSYLGGVPVNIKSDNLKQVVNKSNRYEPLFSEVTNQFAVHYNTSFTAARVAKPRDKASVERHVGIAYKSIYAILEQKVFYSLEELNSNIFILMEAMNNKQMQLKEYSRRQKFEQDELPVLSKMPEHFFEIKHQAKAKVMRNYHVILGEDRHNYSVPYQYVGKSVMLIYDENNVEIYLGLQRIAFHPRDKHKHRYSTLVFHMPTNHQYAYQVRGYTAEYFIKQAKGIGVSTFEVIKKVLEGREFCEQSYNSCLGIIRLKEKYSQERLEKACKITLLSFKINYQTVNNILSNNRDKLDNETETQPFIVTQKTHANIRGKQAYITLFDEHFTKTTISTNILKH